MQTQLELLQQRLADKDNQLSRLAQEVRHTETDRESFGGDPHKDRRKSNEGLLEDLLQDQHTKYAALEEELERERAAAITARREAVFLVEEVERGRALG